MAHTVNLVVAVRAAIVHLAAVASERNAIAEIVHRVAETVIVVESVVRVRRARLVPRVIAAIVRRVQVLVLIARSAANAQRVRVLAIVRSVENVLPVRVSVIALSAEIVRHVLAASVQSVRVSPIVVIVQRGQVSVIAPSVRRVQALVPTVENAANVVAGQNVVARHVVADAVRSVVANRARPMNVVRLVIVRLANVLKPNVSGHRAATA